MRFSMLFLGMFACAALALSSGPDSWANSAGTESLDLFECVLKGVHRDAGTTEYKKVSLRAKDAPSAITALHAAAAFHQHMDYSGIECEKKGPLVSVAE